MKKGNKRDWVKKKSRGRTLIGLPCIIVALVSLVQVGNYALKKDSQKIVFNEICSNNYNVIEDSTGKWRDYIELYNSSDEPVSIGDYYIATRKTLKYGMQLSDEVLNPGEYKVLFLSGQETADGGEAVSLKIDADDGEKVYLYDENGNVMDMVFVPPLSYNTVYARETDGSGDWQYETPTPGKTNESGRLLKAQALDEPVFSHASGFYEDSFYLEISAGEGEEIYYTLDGSTPDENSLHYTGPILIEDNSKKPDIYAGRTDVSSAFLTEMIQLYTDETAPCFETPKTPVDKCSIVRAVCMDEQGAASPVVTQSYFVDFEEKQGYDNLPVISLVTEPENLFDSENGIYVLGENFLQEVEEGLSKHWLWWAANYFEKGREWERPVNISCFSQEKELVYEKFAGIRLKGASSRVYPQKSFYLSAREELDGKGKIQTGLFQENYKTDSIALFSGGNDYHTKLKDYLVSRLTRERSFEVMEYVPCAVFLDGEYWGIYYLAEDYNEDYFKQHYGIEEKNLALIKNMEVVYGEEADYTELENLMIFAAEEDLSRPENYEKLCCGLDMQNYMEYIAAQTYIAHHGDWPQKNTALWKDSRGGKWKWILFDVNSEGSAMEAGLADYNMFPVLEKYEYFYPALIKNEEFKKDFTVMLEDMANLDFSEQRVNKEIDNYLELMGQPMKKHYERYFGGNSTLFREETEGIRDFFNNRRACLYRQMEEEGMVSGTPVKVTVEMEHPEYGKILINGREAELENGIWEGYYYTDYPITIEAVSERNRHFTGWEGSLTSQEEKVELYLQEGGNYLKAGFEK